MTDAAAEHGRRTDRRRWRWQRLSVLALAGGLVTDCADGVALPKTPASFVSVKELPPFANLHLEHLLHNFQAKTGHTMIVWSGDLPEGKQADDYATLLFNAWGVGSKERNDGVALLWFPNARQYRIRVGFGLESAVSDQAATRIGIERIAPKLASGQAAEALFDGVDAVARLVYEHEKSR